MNDDSDGDARPTTIERPWIMLQTTYDVEAWIDQQSHALQRLMQNKSGNLYNTTQCLCFRLEQGGELYLHTTQEGDVLLDVPEDAEWIAPLISAAANVPVVDTQIWQIPGDRLTALIFGLNSLIAAVLLVREHSFKRRKF